jgi:hypothetical protein
MAKPIIELIRKVPANVQEWNQIFRNLTKFLKVSGDELIIGGDIQLPPESVGTAELGPLAVTGPKLGPDSVTNDKLRDSAATSVMGRASGTGGNPADITAVVDDTFLVRRSGALGFGGILDADLPASIARDSEVTAAVAAHEAAGDPHPVYLTQTEGDARYSQYSSGSFSSDLSGCTTTPSVTITWVKSGSMAMLNLQASVSATSNSTVADLNNLPVAVRPVNRQIVPARITDNSVTDWGIARIDPAGTITLFVGANADPFTSSGSKGIGASTLVYSLD